MGRRKSWAINFKLRSVYSCVRMKGKFKRKLLCVERLSLWLKAWHNPLGSMLMMRHYSSSTSLHVISLNNLSTPHMLRDNISKSNTTNNNFSNCTWTYWTFHTVLIVGRYLSIVAICYFKSVSIWMHWRFIKRRRSIRNNNNYIKIEIKKLIYGTCLGLRFCMWMSMKERCNACRMRVSMSVRTQCIT